MIDRPVLSFVPKDQHAVVRDSDEKRLKGISNRYELDFLHSDGSRRTFLVSGGPRLQGTQIGGTMAVLTDITDRKEMEEEIRSLSHDELTCLATGAASRPWRAHWTAGRLKRQVAVIYIDVRQSQADQRHGRATSWETGPVEVAFILKKSFRETDVIGHLARRIRHRGHGNETR
jgi:hypothetical protein